ncbi:hypothetical protein [Micromonospora sp. WMMD737]|uniref:hypothetical protein n=1 Tax=Micromonospora sp. WMMD737 TaxID=3404113 RepID=UPI003B94F2BB
MTVVEVALVAFCLTNLLLTLALVRRLRTQARTLGRLVEHTPPGLRAGDPVADFAAVTVDGSLSSGTDLAAGGLVAVLSPGCGACEEAVTGLAATLAEPGRPAALVVVAADPSTAEPMTGVLGRYAPVVVEAPVTGAVQRALGIREYPALVAVAGGVVTAVGNDIRDLPAVLAAIPGPAR